MERFRFKSGCVIWVVKHLKGDWCIVLCLQLKSFIANMLKYEACLKTKFKCMCITVCSLVMTESLSHDYMKLIKVSAMF